MITWVEAISEFALSNAESSLIPWTVVLSFLWDALIAFLEWIKFKQRCLISNPRPIPFQFSDFCLVYLLFIYFFQSKLQLAALPSGITNHLFLSFAVTRSLHSFKYCPNYSTVIFPFYISLWYIHSEQCIPSILLLPFLALFLLPPQA